MAKKGKIALLKNNPALPRPWKAHPEPLVGGLLAVGYGKNSDFLLVVSDDGLAVFNVLTGRRVAREYTLTEALDQCHYDFETNLAPGIGPLAGQLVQLAGPYGGKIKPRSKDGWELTLGETQGNLQSVFLSGPGMSPNAARVADILDGPFAYGFSDTGRSFIIANIHTLLLFAREK